MKKQRTQKQIEARKLSNALYHFTYRNKILAHRKARPETLTTIRNWQVRRIKAAHKVLNGGLCAGCGKRRRRLQFHHIGADGRQHREEIGNASWMIATWILRNPEAARQRIESRCPKCHTDAHKIIRHITKAKAFLGQWVSAAIAA